MHPALKFIQALGLTYLRFTVEPPEDSGVWQEKDVRGQTVAEVAAEMKQRFLSWFKYQNMHGAGIHVSPLGSIWPVTVVDDVTAQGLAEMRQEGFEPAIVVQTSTNSHHAWVRWKEIGTGTCPENVLAVSRHLNSRWGDPGAIGTNHRGRLPGFTHPRYKNAKGCCPFVRLVESTGQVCTKAGFLSGLWEERSLDRINAVMGRGKAQGKRGTSLSALDDYPRFLPVEITEDVKQTWAERVMHYQENLEPEKRHDSSIQDWHAVGDMIDGFFDPEQIAQAMREDPRISRKQKHIEDYISRTIWKQLFSQGEVQAIPKISRETR